MPDTPENAGAKRPDDKWSKRRESWADKLVDAAANARQKAEDVASSPKTAEVRTNATGFLTTLRDSLKETTTALREGLTDKDATDDAADGTGGAKPASGKAASGEAKATPPAAPTTEGPPPAERPRPRPRPTR